MRNFVLKKRSIIFHLFATLFSGGLWIFIYLFFKFVTPKDKQETYSQHLNDYIPSGNDSLDDYIRIEKKYQKVLDQHYKNIEKINMLYTVANNLTLPNSKEMNQVIDLCLEDIQLAPQIMNYCEELSNNYNEDLERFIPNYVSFQRLAIIYEKQGEYKKAIEVCQKAINLGFYKDGTAGQIPGRMARLIKKLNSKNQSLEEKN